MKNYYSETNQLPLLGEFDVIVIGGGIAGVAAAIASAREGMKVLVIEKTIGLGGQATFGHVVKYLALCDGHGRKVIGGLSEELLKRSIQYGYDNLPSNWKKQLGIEDNKPKDVQSENFNNPHNRCETYFNMPAFLLSLDEMMSQENIEVLFDTVFCNVIMEDDVCVGLIVENKSGRSVYKSKVIVDASGDADVMFRSGAICEDIPNNVSYMCYDIDFKRMRDALDSSNMYRAFPVWRMMGYTPLDGSTESKKKFYGTNAEDISAYIRKSRGLALQFLKNKMGNDYTMISVPSIPAYRKTRRIIGCYELKPQDVHTYFQDSIGCVSDWRRPGPIFEIPYRSLIDKRIKNVITAGRIIASSGDAWEVTRCIPQAASTGQAAGVAAAMTVREQCAIQNIDVSKLQEKLGATGVIIHESQLSSV